MAGYMSGCCTFSLEISFRKFVSMFGVVFVQSVFEGIVIFRLGRVGFVICH